MYDVFSKEWQIYNDIITLKEYSKENARAISCIFFNNEKTSLPIAIDYQKSQNILNIKVEQEPNINTFLEIISEGEYTIYHQNQAVGSIDYNHDKLWLGRFNCDIVELECKIDRHWQEYVKSYRMTGRHYSHPTLHKIRTYELNYDHYKVVILLEQVFKYLVDNKRTSLIAKLSDGLNTIDFQNDNTTQIFTEVKSFLKPYVTEINNTFDHTVLFAGNSHLDLLFKWSEEQTIEKNERTNANFFANFLFDKSKYTIFSQTYLLNLIETYYPYQIEQFDTMISNGKFEIISDALTEFDTNIPHPQSIYNNINYGQKLTKRLFQTKSDVCFLPDTFGYSMALPSILNDLNINKFITTKLLWNDTNTFPYTNFMWNANNGSVISYKTERGYGGNICLQEIANIAKSSTTKNLLYLYGEGDGGGGPSIDDFLTIDVITENFTNISISDLTISEFLNLDDDLPQVEGELYLEKHRGVYTTANWIKDSLRRCESILHNTNIQTYLNEEHPKTENLSNYISYLSFHDTMSGTIIDQALDVVKSKMDEINKTYPDNQAVINYRSLANWNDIITPEISVYNDRSGYFDSWDISANIFANKLNINTIEYQLSNHLNSLNDIEIDVKISRCQHQKLVKLNLFDNLNFERILCDNGSGVTIRPLTNNCVSSQQFEFPHQKFVAFEYQGEYIGIINTNKYGSSYINKYQLSLLKTGVFPSENSENFNLNSQIYIVRATSLKAIRDKANMYNMKQTLNLDNESVSVESILYIDDQAHALLINNSLNDKAQISTAAEQLIFAPNTSKLVKLNELNFTL